MDLLAASLLYVAVQVLAATTIYYVCAYALGNSRWRWPIFGLVLFAWLSCAVLTPALHLASHPIAMDPP
jgi:hypothetical protein